MILLPAGIGAIGRADVAPTSDATWNPSYKSPQAVLSVTDLRLTASSGGDTYANTRANRPMAGLCYASATVRGGAGGVVFAVGVTDAARDFTNGENWIGDTAASVGAWGPGADGEVWHNNGTSTNVGALGDPDDVQFAVRVAARRVWVRQNGGAWAGGGDPAADTSPTATLSGTGNLFLVGLVQVGGTSSRYVQIHPNAASTTGSIPTGFTAANWG